MEDCPFSVVSHDVWDFVKFYSPDARKGRNPVTGGTLEQANQFVECCRLAWQLEDQFRMKRPELALADE